MPKKSLNKTLDKVIVPKKENTLWFSPLDFDYEKFCIVCKFTDKKEFRISTELVEKTWRQARSMNKVPMLILGLRRNKNQIFVLNCRIQIEKEDVQNG
jgi:hypothetical protein